MCSKNWSPERTWDEFRMHTLQRQILKDEMTIFNCMASQNIEKRIDSCSKKELTWLMPRRQM
jgi:hypothetical protein